MLYIFNFWNHKPLWVTKERQSAIQWVNKNCFSRNSLTSSLMLQSVFLYNIKCTRVLSSISLFYFHEEVEENQHVEICCSEVSWDLDFQSRMLSPVSLSVAALLSKPSGCSTSWLGWAFLPVFCGFYLFIVAVNGRKYFTEGNKAL